MLCWPNARTEEQRGTGDSLHKEECTFLISAKRSGRVDGCAVHATRAGRVALLRIQQGKACAQLAPYVLPAYTPRAMALALKLKRMAHKMLLPPAPLLAASLPTAQGLVQMPLAHPVLPQQHFRSLHLHNTSSTTTASLSAAASNAASSGSDCVLPRHHQIAHQPVMLGTTSTPKAEGGNAKASSSNRVPMQRRKVRATA